MRFQSMQKTTEAQNSESSSHGVLLFNCQNFSKGFLHKNLGSTEFTGELHRGNFLYLHLIYSYLGFPTVLTSQRGPKCNRYHDLVAVIKFSDRFFCRRNEKMEIQKTLFQSLVQSPCRLDDQ